MILNGIDQIRPNRGQVRLKIGTQGNNERVDDEKTTLDDFLVVVPEAGYQLNNIRGQIRCQIFLAFIQQNLNQ
jgi:hypothetical protein